MQCLDRAADILETLAEYPGIPLAQVARTVGLHPATTHNILATLCARNYVFNEQGRYRLGPALAALTARAGGVAALPQVVMPYLEEITRTTGESAVVAVLSGPRLMMVATTPSDDGLSCPAPNQIFPHPLRLATGRVLVAYLPAGRRSHYTAAEEHPLRRRTKQVPNPDLWDQEFTAIRRREFCEIMHGTESGSIAVPVRDASGIVLAALGSNSIGRLGDAQQRKRWVSAVEEAGRHVSWDLGYRPQETNVRPKNIRRGCEICNPMTP